ncbi:hypothetical protein FQR65_LT09559 [Abscondita terminalis]|nr:hypothetical protein FQR65_LT09559 [Abscondita terminalis]
MSQEILKKKIITTQVIAAIFVSISGIPNGMHTGWTAPAIPILEAPDSPIPITETDIIWIESTIWIGCIVGLPITIPLLNKYGSKISTIIAAVQSIIAWVLIACAPSVEYIYISRIISGIASNNAFVSTPIYIAEISDKRVRGFLGTFTYITMLTGIIMVYSIVPFVSLITSSLIGAAFLVIQLLILPFMPDTPYFLIAKGYNEEAKKSLRWLRETDEVDEEFMEITLAVERQKNFEGRFIDLFKIKSNRKAMIIMTILNFTQHFSGISAMLMNIHSILKDLVSVSANTASILFSVLMLLSALVSSIIIDKIGRKSIMGWSCILTGTSLMAIAIYFTVKSEIDVKPYNWVLLTAILLYAISFKFGIGLVPIVMTAEIFPANVKAMGVTMADAAYVIFGYASINMYQLIVQNYEIYVVFYIFALCCCCAGLFTFLYIPETSGKSLEEIQMLLNSSEHHPTYGPTKHSNDMNPFDAGGAK